MAPAPCGGVAQAPAVQSIRPKQFTLRRGRPWGLPVTRDKCTEDAVFIYTTGGWVKGRENFIEMISRLHAPGGPFHDRHTRCHTLEELRFIRKDVAAVVKTLISSEQACPQPARKH